MRKEGATIMSSIFAVNSGNAAGMSWTLCAPAGEHPVIPTAAAEAAPRKRRAAAAAIAASVGGHL